MPVWVLSVIRSSAYFPALCANSNPLAMASAAAPAMAARAAPAASRPPTTSPPATSPTPCRASRRLSLSLALSAASLPSSAAASPASLAASPMAVSSFAVSRSTCSASFRVMLVLSVASPAMPWASARVFSPLSVSCIRALVSFICEVALFRAMRSWSACLLFSP